MTLIRVEPESIRRYGHAAQTIFDGMHSSLIELVDQVVAVRYFGPNAFTFKSEVGRLAADFANRLHVDMQSMSEAVRTSTTNIAAALGGSPISIRLDPRPITPPAPAAADFVDVDTAALEALIPVVINRFEALRGGLGSNVTQLQATDWQGNAKRLVVEAVTRVSSSARARCDTAEVAITSFVRSQLEGVLAADR
ncbi:MAG TPA: hypothetical protein VE487_15345 [Ilumatobacter sp.]|jgi:hypothetical protein|nr:hypothetical protein [Ilumatobacter sp.]